MSSTIHAVPRDLAKYMHKHITTHINRQASRALSVKAATQEIVEMDFDTLLRSFGEADEVREFPVRPLRDY
jgi:hypothetical protein